ncbi:unnamed protein product, partial [Mycena citricolor]
DGEGPQGAGKGADGRHHQSGEEEQVFGETVQRCPSAAKRYFSPRAQAAMTAIAADTSLCLSHASHLNECHQLKDWLLWKRRYRCKKLPLSNGVGRFIMLVNLGTSAHLGQSARLPLRITQEPGRDHGSDDVEHCKRRSDASGGLTDRSGLTSEDEDDE